MEEVLQPVMYDIPSRDDVAKVQVTGKVRENVNPTDRAALARPAGAAGSARLMYLTWPAPPLYLILTGCMTMQSWTREARRMAICRSVGVLGWTHGAGHARRIAPIHRPCVRFPAAVSAVSPIPVAGRVCCSAGTRRRRAPRAAWW